MTPVRWINKDPDDIDTRAIGGWLEHIGEGDKVVSAEFLTSSPSGLGIGPHEVSTDGDKVSVWVESGSAGVDYTVTCRATTQAGRRLDRSALILVTQR